jgi:hypothetical protein
MLKKLTLVINNKNKNYDIQVINVISELYSVKILSISNTAGSHLLSNPPVTCGLPTSYMWASHQVHVGVPENFIRRPGSIEARASPLHNQSEQLQNILSMRAGN